MKTQGYSPIHKLMWLRTPTGIKMSDDTEYTNKELAILKKHPEADKLLIHDAKKIFDGVIVS